MNNQITNYFNRIKKIIIIKMILANKFIAIYAQMCNTIYNF